jgi:FAD/FMN-containing dehydrogenase/Fe-S oxidoreductase
MEPERERIQEDLRGILQGEVRCDDVFLQMYASDASIFEILPLGVVRPRSATDVVALMQYAYEHDIPIHPRGAGTGLAGESLGHGLVVDFSRYMRRIVAVGDDWVRVQPGVVHAQLNRQLAERGQIFGPDPATSQVTTMGSVLAIDASGSYWLRYGSARGHVESMQIVLADGRMLEVGRESLAAAAQADDGRRDIVGSLAALIRREVATIAAHQPRSKVNRSGYHLHGVLEEDHLDLAKLIVGSEGTLALITEATLRTQPLPAARGVVLLFFDRLEAAAIASLQVPPLGAVACDLMDRRLLSIARETDPRYDALLPAAAEAMLLVEFHGEHAEEVRRLSDQLVSRVQRQSHMAFDARTATAADDIDFFWQLPRRVVPMLYRLRGNERPLPFIEDIAVPPSDLPDFLRRLQDVLKRNGVVASLFGHAGHGQLHVRPFLDLGNPSHQELVKRLTDEVYEHVLAVGGTISGEHADGLSRSPYVRRQYGELYNAFREVKRIFDPHNILNPGKVVCEDRVVPRLHFRPSAIASPDVSTSTTISSGVVFVSGGAGKKSSKLGEASTTRDTPRQLTLLLDWDEEDFSRTARTCNGCGHCRTLSPDARMCPIFRNAPSEEASPRAKANLMRAVLTGRLPVESLHTDELKTVADLCVNCHQCRLECPANVDIPRLMTEAKGQYVATNGLSLREWLLSRIDQVAALGSLVSPLANWALSSRTMRWILEKVMGIAQGRKLPRLAPRSFLRTAQRRRLTRPTRRPGHKVLYFVDIYANWFDVQLAEAFLAVMEHNGARVYVHPQQHSSGMHLLSLGVIDRARRLAARNVAKLADAVRQGYVVVTTEPSAALALKHEYPQLLSTSDAQLVAENTSEACTYLWELHRKGKLELDLQPLNATVGYHLPCHLRALEVGTPGENLLRLVPGLTVRRIEKGCSGMAGVYGLKRENYRASLRAGWGLISALRSSSLQAGTTECSTCKMQMEQGTTKPTLHPIKLLALAYGRMPELASRLSARGEELVVT